MTELLDQPGGEKLLVETKQTKAIRSMFDRISPTYDLLNHLLSFNVDRYWRRVTAKVVMAQKPERVLDVCCGTGDLALALRRAAMRAGVRLKCVATDFAPAMVRRAAQKFAAANPAAADSLHAAIADTLQLPFRDNTFDAVTVAFGIRNVADLDAGLRELVRVVRPGGTVAILEFSQPRSRVFAPLYRFYSFRVMPWLGKLISGTRAYAYLPASVDAFPCGEEFLSRLHAACHGSVCLRELTWGIATLYCGTVAKPGARGDAQPPPGAS